MTPFQKEVFFEIHSNNLREGPGSFEATRKAFSLLKGLPARPIILDIGCGPGEQTIHLAQISDAVIYAVDKYDLMLNSLKKRVIENNLIPRVHPINADINSLRFEKKFFDVIWGEGSIYNAGFGTGLKILNPFLKHGGYIAVSELTWINDNQPDEITRYWKNNYPAITYVSNNVETISNCGYKIVENFVLDESAWIDNYYLPIEKKLSVVETKYGNHPEAIEIINSERREFDMYKKYSKYYGYVFYVMQKT